MKNFHINRFLFLTLFLLVATPLQASDTPPRIDQFASTDWGSGTDTIQVRYGKPDHTDNLTLDDGVNVQFLGYTQTLLGEQVKQMFLVHPVKGLIKGYYWIPFGKGRDCLTTYNKVLSALKKLYPEIEPSIHKRNKSGKPFCQAQAEGKAGAFSTFEDPYSNNTISLLLEAGEKNIGLHYETNEFLKHKAGDERQIPDGKL